jgi:cell wall assembly regulator SMI1
MAKARTKHTANSLDYEAMVRKLSAKVDLEHAGPASPAAVAKLEKKLKTSLPPSYRTFLLQVGWLAIHDTYVEGISSEKMTILDQTANLKEDFDVPDGVLLISAHADGGYCLDLNQRRKDGEAPVISFEGDYHPEGIAAQSFAEWFQEFIYKCYISWKR